MTTPDLATLRLFADMRQARLQLRGLESPNPKTRARLIQDPAIHKALTVLLFAAEKLVAGPNEDALFWHPSVEPLTAAELRWQAMFQIPIRGEDDGETG